MERTWKMNKVKVSIAGKTHIIRTKGAPGQLLQLADGLNRHIAALCAQNETLAATDALILVALNMAEELSEQKKEIELSREAVSARDEKLKRFAELGERYKAEAESFSNVKKELSEQIKLVKQKNAEIARLEKDLEKKTAEAESLSARLEEASKQLGSEQKKASELSAKSSKTDQLHSQIKAKDAEIEGLKAELESLSDENKRLNEQLSELLEDGQLTL